MSWINIKIWTISPKFHYPYEWIFGKATPPEYIIKEVTWNWYINLTNAVANRLTELKVYGWTEQNWTPTPDSPTDIVCNNWAIKFSKNLANIIAENITEQKYIDNSWRIQDSPVNFIYSTYIPVKPNTDYTLSWNKNFRYASLMEYDVDKNFIKRTLRDSTTWLSKSWTTANNTAYILFWSNSWYNETMTLDVVQTYNFQFEEWNTATEYRQYWQIYTDWLIETIKDWLNNTATAEMLLKVGDYQDEQEILSWNITRKVGMLVLDGVTDGRKLTATWNATYKRGNITVPTIKQTSYLIADCVCTHFPYSTSTQGAPTSPGFCSREQDKLILFTFAGMSDINSSSDANAFLADQYNAWTPVIVLYPLDEETTETVAGQTINIPAWNSKIEITQASIDNLWLYAKYKATA